MFAVLIMHFAFLAVYSTYTVKLF